MKTFIALITACFLAATAKAADMESAPIFQMRLVAETPSVTTEPMSMVWKNGDKTVTTTLNVEKSVLIDQKALKSAHVNKDSLGRPMIEFEFNKNGTEQFATVTQQNLHKQLAIIIDGHLTSAPRIQSPITGGKGVITGSFTKEEAKDLAARINAVAKK